MNTTYLGIDLHKHTQTWVALAENGKDTLFTKVLPVTPEGVQAGIKLSQQSGDKIVAAIEPTCGWAWVVPLLRECGIEVHISNPRKVRAISDSLQKTDKNDATILAQLVKTGIMHESREVNPEMQTLRALVRERVFLVHLRASMKCRLESVVTRNGRHCIKWSLSSLKGKNALIEKGEAEWKRSLDVIADVSIHITQIDKEISRYGKQSIPTLLMTIPGVGVVTAVSTWAEVGEYAHFSTPEKLCAFAGLVPTERSSGGVQKLGHITKAGSPILRCILVEAAMRIRDTQKSGVLYAFYKNIKTTRGAMRARVALARKILAISWYMVKKNESYQQRFTTNIIESSVVEKKTLLSSARIPMRGDLVFTL
jgi:transposase